MDGQFKPEKVSNNGEAQSGANAEQLQPGALEQASGAEAGPVAGPGASAAGPPAGQTPVLSADDVAAAIAAAPSGGEPPVVQGTPDVAGDVDVIEPEWVDKAEQEISRHQGDPYGEEEAIEDLNQDYLKKRYNFTVEDAHKDSSKPEGA